MRKLVTINIAAILLMLVFSLASTALYTANSKIYSSEVSAGDLNIMLDSESVKPQSVISAEGDSIPGDHNDYKITITNDGGLEARWRLGLRPDETLSAAANDQAFRNQVIVTFCEYDETTGAIGPVIRSINLNDLLLPETLPYPEDRWIYDTDLAGAASFVPLQPGESQTLIMTIDYDLPAEADARDGGFDGQLYLEGAQVNDTQWWPSN